MIVAPLYLNFIACNVESLFAFHRLCPLHLIQSEHALSRGRDAKVLVNATELRRNFKNTREV